MAEEVGRQEYVGQEMGGCSCSELSIVRFLA